MSAMIYVIIIVLFLVYISWTWNSTHSFEGKIARISYILVGTAVITFVTYIIFLISKNGINYPVKEMIGATRNIILLTFVPINGFLILPQIANTLGKVKKDEITPEQFKKRLVIFIIAIIVIVVFECSYFKGIQNGIIEFINTK